ncbi:MAG: M20/M25/M40 family metallo-hydrolase [Anaerolineae bacterium]|nr:M20/M25/M40 family metallo-hydrolase [Anaerolineae bacterium]
MSDEAIELLTHLVAIPSPSEEEAAASAYLAGWMNEHGLTAYVDEAGSAVGMKGDGPKEILLLGHIDTFPGEVPVRREGDLLYGRGTVDAKGPLCTFAAATSRVEVPPGWRVTVVGAVEEEAATSKGARYVLSQRLQNQQQGGRGAEGQGRNLSLAPPLPRPPAFCVIGEPSHWDRVTLGYKGRLLLDVVLRVPFSHSAGEGRLPAEQAVDLWRQVEQFCAQVNKDRQADTPFNRLDPSLRHIASRDEGAFGVVQLGMGFRLPVGLGLAELEQELRQVIQTLPAGTSAQLQFSGGEPAYKGDKSNPLVRTFLRAIRAAGDEPRFVVKTGTADMNVVAPHWPDTPVVAYGPGDSGLDHTPHEHIDLNEYLRAIDVLQSVLVNLMA